MRIDYNSLKEVRAKLHYYERLLCFLDDMIPNLDDVIEQFDGGQE